MAQYFTDRLQRVFHLIFMSYDPQSAQEGLRILSSGNPDSAHVNRGPAYTRANRAYASPNSRSSGDKAFW